MRTSLAATARRFLRWEFIPEAVLFAGLTAFFLDQTDAATSAFKSTKAVAIMAVVGLGWLGARAALARLVRFAGQPPTAGREESGHAVIATEPAGA